ncbi:hypothetical protein BDR26DRAFT_873045 [Obelidium mucronatum]|nr:hypothetical protein BDR26DRAFT_873045 [Obelidium mucronatum]
MTIKTETRLLECERLIPSEVRITKAFDRVIKEKEPSLRQFIGFICFQLLISVPIGLIFCIPLLILLPHGGGTTVSLLSTQAQLVKLPTLLLKSATFNSQRHSNVKVTLYEQIPQLLPNVTKTSSIVADFSATSLKLETCSSTEIYSSFGFYLIKGGALSIDYALPVRVSDRQVISLSVSFIPEFTTASQRIYDWPVTAEEYFPLQTTDNLYESRSNQVALVVQHTGYYIVNFVQRGKALAQSGNYGYINITANTPVYDTSSAIKTCSSGNCELFPSNGDLPVYYALFESVDGGSGTTASNFLDISKAMEAASATDLFAFDAIQQAKDTFLEGAGFKNVQYYAIPRVSVYLPLLVSLSTVWFVVTCIVVAPLFGISLSIFAEKRDRFGLNYRV